MGCDFCTEISEASKSLFYEEIGKKHNLTNRILFEDDNWIVIPTIGCFTLGYLLIVNKEHYLSIALLPNTSIINDLENLIKKIRDIYQKEFQSPIIAFEHGSIEEYRLSGCCVDHLHLHILPFNKDCWSEIKQKDDLKYKEISNLHDIKSIVTSESMKAYLFFQNIDNKKYLINVKDSFPSQYFRRIFANKIDSNLKWDWKECYYDENMIKTIKLSRTHSWFKGMK